MQFIKKILYWLNTPYDVREYYVTGRQLFFNWVKNIIKLLIWLVLVYPVGWLIVSIGKAVGIIKYDDAAEFVYLLIFLIAIIGIIIKEYQISEHKKHNKWAKW
jgi:hypothetical protein